MQTTDNISPTNIQLHLIDMYTCIYYRPIQTAVNNKLVKKESQTTINEINKMHIINKFIRCIYQY